MAAHIDSVATSGIPVVDKLSFYHQLEWGDLIFCSGQEPISRGIEQITKSPFSHVLMAWLPNGANQWLTLESTFQTGVHIGRLCDYVDSYDGDIVMTRRSALTDANKTAALNAGLNVLEDAYDWQQEVSIVAHKLVKALPVEKPKKEYYCSGLQWLMSKATPFPLQMPGPNLPTPEDNFTDPSVEAVCAMLKA